MVGNQHPYLILGGIYSGGKWYSGNNEAFNIEITTGKHHFQDVVNRSHQLESGDYGQ